MNPIPIALGVGAVMLLVYKTAKGETVSVPDVVSVQVKPPTTPAPSNLPAGLRNHNPTNLKGKGWRGQIGSDSQGHGIFDTFINGLRAAAIDIHTGFVRDHEDTVRKILDEWAGAEAPSITNYYAHVSKRMGVGIDSPMQYHTHIIPLLKAISEFEVGIVAYRNWNPPHDLFVEAVRQAGR